MKPARSGAVATAPTNVPGRFALDDGTYFPWFDWLRGVLALSVVLAHEGIIGWPLAGNFAVQVFFALSGWLIGGVLIHTERTDLPRFYFNRAVRIWVPYYIALALLLGVSLLRDNASLKWFEFVLYKLTFVYNLLGTPQLATHLREMPLGGTGNHFWSVNAEEQFYLMAPLLLVLSAPAFGRGRMTWLLLSTLSWSSHLGTSIVFGVTAAVFASHDEPIFRRPAARATLALLGVAATIGLSAQLSYDVFAPVVAISIVLLLSIPGRRQPLGSLVGGMSYPLYLNHWIGVFVAHAVWRRLGLGESAATHVLSAVINVAFAVVLYLSIDRPLLWRRTRWYTPALGRRALICAYAMIGAGLAFGAAFRAISP